MKKGTIPKGALLTADVDALFERLAAADIERLPVSVWGEKKRSFLFWRTLGAAHPATRKRLLVQILTKCAADNCAPPVALVEAISRELGVSEAPRAQARDISKLKEAAFYKARNPSASLEEIASAIGIPGKKTTVLSFMQRPEFDRMLADEKILLQIDAGRDEPKMTSARPDSASKKATRREK